ncbi:nucleoside deaminase [Clostridium sp. CF012]|uniref:nucleoside deaminase n=1 Tax=Clostridium sp. CF012 TaxID=2843319 RepID=UPI001C0CFD8D|nr:nucleoside deaminase [Clostridium sp. CF012]MBU3143811.1 nucleoside deaminase [Clostridium sp. CF012]
MAFSDEYFMLAAIEMAQYARDKGEYPFGAVLVYNAQIVHKSYDRSIELCDPTFHAELALISEYCRSNHKLNLQGYSLYSSAEPCVMCSGSIKWSHISKVIFSVSQSMLQQMSGGRTKPSCDSILNTGQKKIEVIGPFISDEGLKVFDGYTFISKNDRIKFSESDLT